MWQDNCNGQRSTTSTCTTSRPAGPPGSPRTQSTRSPAHLRQPHHLAGPDERELGHLLVRHRREAGVPPDHQHDNEVDPDVSGTKAAYVRTTAGELRRLVVSYFDTNGVGTCTSGYVTVQSGQPRIDGNTSSGHADSGGNWPSCYYAAAIRPTSSRQRRQRARAPDVGQHGRLLRHRNGNEDIYAMTILTPSLTMSAPSSVAFGDHHGDRLPEGMGRLASGEPDGHGRVPAANRASTALLRGPYVDTNSVTAGTSTPDGLERQVHRHDSRQTTRASTCGPRFDGDSRRVEVLSAATRPSFPRSRSPSRAGKKQHLEHEVLHVLRLLEAQVHRRLSTCVDQVLPQVGRQVALQEDATRRRSLTTTPTPPSTRRRSS